MEQNEKKLEEKREKVQAFADAFNVTMSSMGRIAEMLIIPILLLGVITAITFGFYLVPKFTGIFVVVAFVVLIVFSTIVRAYP